MTAERGLWAALVGLLAYLWLNSEWRRAELIDNIDRSLLVLPDADLGKVTRALIREYLR